MTKACLNHDGIESDPRGPEPYLHANTLAGPTWAI